MDYYSPQSLHFNERSEYTQNALRHAITIFDRLADLYIGSVLDEKFNTNQYMYTFLDALITYDLGYEMDDNIIIQARHGGYIKVSLANTDYTMDQKANIYYIIYAWPFMKGFNNTPTFPVGQFQDNDCYMPSSGLGLYTLPRKDAAVDQSFLKTFMADVPFVNFDEQGEFAGSFIILSMAYTIMNGYGNFLDAKDANFTAVDPQYTLEDRHNY